MSAARLNAALSCGDYRIVVTGIHNGGGRDKFITVGIERGAFWRFGDVYARSMGRFHAPRARLSIDIFVKGVSPNGKAARIGIFRSRVFTGLHRLYATPTKILCGKSVHIALDLTTNPKRDVHGVSSADVVVLYQGVVSSDDNVLPNSVQVDEYDSGRYLYVYVGRTHYGAKPRHQWANVAAFCGYVRRPRVRASVPETLRRRSWVVSG